MKKITALVFFQLLTISAFSQQLPYPIIFIHGLNSNSKTWDDMKAFLVSKGLSYGGRIDFSLNDDGNNLTSNKLFWPQPGADIAIYTDIQQLPVGDFYMVNFDINNIGQLFPSDNPSAIQDMLSNEAAIAKQGKALQYAIDQVLYKTGKDKVILMGHSMGGLCAREYLQNPDNWTDGYHHVAKLITTGTPHGGYTGYNSTMITGIDSGSEAYRDLRREYSNGIAGAYLFGNPESAAAIGNSFYNNDINCNGTSNDNSYIVGLNQKEAYLNQVDYAYIIGLCTDCIISQGTIPGDGIVRAEYANLSNIYTMPDLRNEFFFTASSVSSSPIPQQIHTILTKQIPVNMQGLDEPNEYQFSYGINAGQIYKGFITTQPINGHGHLFDYDDYKFTVSQSGNVTVGVSNTFTQPLTARILDMSLNILASVDISNIGSVSHYLTPGQYYLEFYALPSNVSYLYPYTFYLENNLSVDANSKTTTVLYPNPVSSKLFINSEDSFDKIEIYNLIGEKVTSTADYKSGIDLHGLSTGTYIVKLYTKYVIQTQKVIKY